MSKKSLAIAYQMKKKAKRGTEQAIHLDEKRGYGNQKEHGVHAASYSHGNDRGASQAGEAVRSGSYKKKERMADAKEHHKEKLSELKSDKGDRKNLAEGGEVETPDDGPVSEEEAKKFKEGAGFAKGGSVGCKNCGYSEGGMVANKQGEGVDDLPNEFDDLALRDELEFKYTGANSGDEKGGPSKNDLVARAMLRRKKR